MEKFITKVRIKQKEDGSLSEYIPIGVEAKNIITKDNILIEDKIAKKIYYFDTVNDMKQANYLEEGDSVITLGYYSSNDGGGAEYQITSVVSGYCEDLLNNLKAKLIIGDSIYAKQIGAYGDNLHDDTAILNTFFSISTSAKKVVNRGVYLITGTIYIKGIWRQGSTGQNNGNVEYHFDKATFNYQGEVNGISVMLYNMFKQRVVGLATTRYSKANSVVVLGAWHCTFEHFDIKNLLISSSSSLISGLSASTTSVEHINFTNGYILGNITIDPENNYINGVYFENDTIFSTNSEYCVNLLRKTNKQELVFDKCDLSYATKCVFNVPEKQTGSCGVTLRNCYLDSSIPVFSNKNPNGILFSAYDLMMPANTNNQVLFNETKDFLYCTNLGGYTYFGSSLPTMNVNCLKNGNFEIPVTISGDYNTFFGQSSSASTLSWVPSNKNIFGRARRVQINNVGQRALSLYGINAPWTGVYTLMSRFKVISGHGFIQFLFAGVYTQINIEEGKEYTFIENKNHKEFQEGTALNCNIYINRPADAESLIIEFYEMAVCPGLLALPNMPLHIDAKMSTE